MIQFLLIVLSFTDQTTAQRDVCPPWFVPDNMTRTGCSYNSYGRDVKCLSDSDSLFLQLGNCMTYNSATNTTEYGPCPYIAHYNITYMDYGFYIQMPSNVSELNEFMCGPLNRRGPLCRYCIHGYGTALYSYTLECSKCWGHDYGWVLYYFLQLFPITVMYVLVVIFHIRATSSPLSAIVFMSQIVVYTIRLNVPLHMFLENNVTGFLYVAMQVLLVLCGIWSLDFFRSIIPPFCVSTNLDCFLALVHEYLVAFYPICLMLITYACIKLHDNNFRPVVWLWKPFHRHFVHVRRRWDSTASIINAFTTFLLLAFSKILYASCMLLHTSYIHYNNSGDIKRKCVLYYNPKIECYGQEYFMLLALAGCVLILFVISPTLLLILYPTRLFRRLVSCCGFRRWHALHTFVESFQGQYKDGTNGTRDFRVVSALLLILRILIIAVSLLSHYYPTSGSPALQCVLFASASCFYAVVRPYKSNFSNNIDILVLVLLEMMSFSIIFVALHHENATFTVLVALLLLGVPHMSLMFYSFYGLAKKAGITQCLKRKYQRCMLSTRCLNQDEADMEAESDTGSLPDRLMNPGEYEPMRPTTDHAEHITTNEDRRRPTPLYTYGSTN